MGAFAFSHPDDNLIDSALAVTLATGTAVDSESDQLNLNDGNPARGLVVTGNDLDVVFQWSGAVLPKLVAVIHSTLAVAAHIQGHTSSSWGAPDVDVALGVPTLRGDSFYSAPHKNLSAQAAKAFWRLHVATNGQQVAIGELWLGSTYRQFASTTNYLLEGHELKIEGTTIVHETGYGVELAYQQAARRDRIDGSVIVNAADLALLEAWVTAAKFRARPFVFIPDVAIDDAWMVKLATDSVAKASLGNGYYRVALPLKQVSRGLAW